MPLTLEALCAALNPQVTSLVLGAGASVPSGAPTGAGFAQSLWGLVAKSSAQSEDLIDTATVLERRYGRQQVVEAVRKVLNDLRPQGGLLALPSFPWRQLYTTNFDRLIEKAYQASSAPFVVMRSNFDLSTKDSIGKTVLYKIHGCISQDRSFGDRPSMTLTEDDYDTHGEFRQSLFASLETALLSGDVLVIGQSLRDRHLSDLVKRILKAKNQGAPGQIYVLVYDQDDMRAPLLEDKGAKVAFGNIDKFVALLAQGYASPVTLAINSDEILPAELLSSVVNVSTNASNPSNVIRMFNGGSATYSDIKANATFERQRTADILQHLESCKTPFAIVTGAAGVGKSTLCRQIMVQLERKGFLAWELKKDLPFRDDPWVKVESELRAKGQRGVLFLDECTRNLRQVNELVDHISGIDEPAIRVLLAANSAQWAPRVKSPNIYKKGTAVHLTTLEEAELNSLVNLVEHNSEIAGMVHESFKSLSRSDQLVMLRRKASADMFVCLKNIFANENLDTILLREFEQLDINLQDQYRYVAALEAVGMKVHRHLLIRMLQIEPTNITAALSGLTGIVDEYDIDPKEGVFGWRTRHLVIARKITDYKFSGATELAKLFKKIVDNVNPTVSIERHSISNICDSEFGIGRIGDGATRLSLYRRLTKIAPGERIPWHRIIRELLACEQLDEAEYAIREAEAAVGHDAPLDRYRVRLLVKRAQHTSGISSTDRDALLRRAYELASKNVDNHKWDRHSYKTLCDVALLLSQKGTDEYLIDEALNRMRIAAAEICDPEMDRDLRRLENEKSRH